MKNVLLVLVIALVLIGGYYVLDYTDKTDEADVTDNGRVRGPEELPLSVGDTKNSGNLSITLNSIVSDNRCAVDVQCVQAGWVTANITVKTDTQITQDINSNDLTLEYDGYAISINEVLPAPRSTVVITPEEYVVTFLVAPL
ncbi:MAG: hypothetical protein AAB458_01635 [Patescibacteria group bacterium]